MMSLVSLRGNWNAYWLQPFNHRGASMFNSWNLLSLLLLAGGCANNAQVTPMGRQNLISVESNLELLRATSNGVSTCRRIDHDLIYVGETDVEFFECLLQNQEIDRLHITSHGGDVTFAIAGAQEIHRRKINVTIYGFCSSSCANYVIPAAASVTVRYPTLIMLHGAPPGDEAALRQSISREFEKFSLPDEEKPALIEAQVHKLTAVRRLHDAFTRQFDIGPLWYALPKAPAEVVNKRTHETGVRFSFLRKCFPGKKIGTDRDIDAAGADRLTKGVTNVVLIAGLDYPEPATCGP